MRIISESVLMPFTKNNPN